MCKTVCTGMWLLDNLALDQKSKENRPDRLPKQRLVHCGLEKTISSSYETSHLCSISVRIVGKVLTGRNVHGTSDFYVII